MVWTDTGRTDAKVVLYSVQCCTLHWTDKNNTVNSSVATGGHVPTLPRPCWVIRFTQIRRVFREGVRGDRGLTRQQTCVIKQQIVCTYGFWERSPQIPTRAPPLDPAGRLLSPTLTMPLTVNTEWREAWLKAICKMEVDLIQKSTDFKDSTEHMTDSYSFQYNVCCLALHRLAVSGSLPIKWSDTANKLK